MGRNTGPKAKLVRKFGENIFGNPKFDKILKDKPHGPGEHGMKRKKVSEYGIQLKEKQKLKITYGLYERQFRNYFEKANKQKGRTGENLIKLLERRLDNVVYRLGFAASRMQARQLVSHRHILVNGSLVDIPSYLLSPGDVIQIKEKSRKMDLIHNALKRVRENTYGWLTIDKASLSGTFVQIPDREDVPVNSNEQLIVELYSK